MCGPLRTQSAEVDSMAGIRCWRAAGQAIDSFSRWRGRENHVYAVAEPSGMLQQTATNSISDTHLITRSHTNSNLTASWWLLGLLSTGVLQGTLEADLTVTKIGPDDFMVVASDTAHRHVEAMMARLASLARFGGESLLSAARFSSDDVNSEERRSRLTAVTASWSLMLSASALMLSA